MSFSDSLDNTIPSSNRAEAFDPQILKAMELGRARAREEYEKAIAAEAVAKVLLGMSNGNKLSDSMHAPRNRAASTSSSNSEIARAHQKASSKNRRAGRALRECLPSHVKWQNSHGFNPNADGTLTVPASTQSTTATPASESSVTTTTQLNGPVKLDVAAATAVPAAVNTASPDASTIKAMEMGRPLARKQHQEALEVVAF
ncbi:hypothetical protein QBC35DRAFT_448710 [Podospora australis]|uniref:Uncharacterized protein n=1 Tax=Podospora australis TaxID=1536484 RepID=A0AAN7AM22_9PEZI|nr:hypothetical protein QBC35DRAFT_448710 [Podospora australis]